MTLKAARVAILVCRALQAGHCTTPPTPPSAIFEVRDMQQVHPKAFAMYYKDQVDLRGSPSLLYTPD
jgi:hypothetical protein